MQNYESKLIDSSRMIADIMTADILDDQERFDEMFSLALKDEYPLSMRAARIVELSTNKYPQLINSHINELIDTIEKSKIDGVKRSFLKILVEHTFISDEILQGRLVNIAFSLLENNKEAIAIRAFSIDILFKFTKLFPELKSELIPMLQSISIDSSKGMQSKCTKILKHLTKY
jgi:hypothetical protein